MSYLTIGRIPPVPCFFSREKMFQGIVYETRTETTLFHLLLQKMRTLVSYKWMCLKGSKHRTRSRFNVLISGSIEHAKFHGEEPAPWPKNQCEMWVFTTLLISICIHVYVMYTKWSYICACVCRDVCNNVLTTLYTDRMFIAVLWCEKVWCQRIRREKQYKNYLQNLTHWSGENYKRTNRSSFYYCLNTHWFLHLNVKPLFQNIEVFQAKKSAT